MLMDLHNINLTLSGKAGPVPILHDVSLNFKAGESVAIVGPSGSGKTSLLMICAGLLQPTTGHIRVNGEDITGYNEDRLAVLRQQTLGIVFQNFHLIPTMTAIENVAIPLELAGMTDARARAEAALQDVQLGHRLTHYPSQLSGGEQQRVAIARALSLKPQLILADEPTGNLDQQTGMAIMQLLFSRVKEQGATLVLITHDPHLAESCDRKIHIRDGRVQ